MYRRNPNDWLISPERFFGNDIRFGNLLGNKSFIESLIEYSRIVKEFQFWKKEKIEEIQNTRLNNLLESINKKYEGGNIITIHSSGTSGIQKKILIDEREGIISWFPCRLTNPAFNFDEKLIKNIFNRKFVICLGGSTRVWLKDFMYLLRTTPVDLIDKINRELIYEKINEVHPAFVIGPGSSVSALARKMDEDGFDLSHLLALELTTEPILSEEKSFINNLKIPLLNTFSSAEAGPIGFECPNNPERFHLFAQRMMLEVINENGLPARDGDEGELVITVLDRRVMPIIRYALGDRGKIISDSCPCGRSLPLFELSSRRGDKLKLSSGREVPSSLLYMSLKRAEIGKVARAFQIRQNAVDQIELLIVPSRKKRARITEETELKFRLALTEFFYNERMLIEVRKVDAIPVSSSGKTLFFVPLQ
ncbi:hypothetical protein HYT00_00300 [Candidatus Giovannonibacteria bacterium]|nr:hypothetical protein [Candidatus Giovannonibacteria bacterium]